MIVLLNWSIVKDQQLFKLFTDQIMDCGRGGKGMFDSAIVDHFDRTRLRIP